MKKMIAVFVSVLTLVVLLVSSESPVIASDACLACSIQRCNTQVRACLAADGCGELAGCVKRCSFMDSVEACVQGCMVQYDTSTWLPAQELIKCQINACRGSCR